MQIIKSYEPEKHAKWIYNNHETIFNEKNWYHIVEYKLLKGWIYLIANKIVGSCLYGVDLNDVKCGRESWYFAYLGILPEYQNLGIGSMLLKKLIEHADKCRANLECNTYNTNTSAINLYTKNDFVISKTGHILTLNRRPKKLKS